LDLVIDEELIFIGESFESDIESLEFLADQLVKRNYVKDTYKEALLQRENEFPTGLNFGAYGVAIPHSDAIHVNKSTLGIVVPAKPVVFQSMDGSGEVEVGLICIIVLKEKQNQAPMLSSLMNLFSDEKAVEELSSGNVSVIKKYLMELVSANC